jgi:hypothetical protein
MHSHWSSWASRGEKYFFKWFTGCIFLKEVNQLLECKVAVMQEGPMHCTFRSAVRKLRQTGGELPKGLRVRIKTEKNPGTDPTILTHITRRLVTALQRKNAENWKQIFPEKEYRGLSPNFHNHVSVSELYIPTMELPFLLEEICGPILGIYKSLTDT